LAPSQAPPSSSPVPREPALFEATPTSSAAPISVVATDAYIGTVVDGRYRIENLIGGGNIGIVYRARHTMLNKRVAVKILRSELARDPTFVERFLIEAKAGSSVDNPHVINISDYGQLPDGTAYIAMDYIDGQPLSELLHTCSRVPLPRLISIAKQIAEGLQSAHDQDIIHRDLKPDNLILTQRPDAQDFVTIVDFGIAKVMGLTNHLTLAGMMYGTPHYMSPEQAEGKPVDHRSDIYALGIILFEMACGNVPFQGENPMVVISKHIYQEPPVLREIAPEVHPELEAIVVRCMAKVPADRYASMREVWSELDAIEKELTPDAVRLSWTPSRSTRPSGYPPVIAAEPHAPMPSFPLYRVVLLVLAVVGVGVGWNQWAKRNSAPLTDNGQAFGALATTSASAAASQSAATLASEASCVPVALVLSPIDAHVFQGKNDLGTMPVSVSVCPGDTTEVEVRRDGHVSRKLTLDTSQTKRIVRLVPLLDANNRASSSTKVIGPRPSAIPLHPDPTIAPERSPSTADANDIQELPAPKPSPRPRETPALPKP